MSDKGKEGKYRSIFSGPSKDCYLMDLRPNTEYHIRVHAVMKSRNLKGGASDTVSFHTKVSREEGAGKNKINVLTFTIIDTNMQCSGSGFRCLFEPWIRNLRWVKSQYPDPDPE